MKAIFFVKTRGRFIRCLAGWVVEKAKVLNTSITSLFKIGIDLFVKYAIIYIKCRSVGFRVL